MSENQGSDKRRRLGHFGESAAAAYLLRQGYTILERNWRCAIGELDLITQHGEELVFVEVRARQGYGSYGSPEESLTPAKQARLISLAYAYLEAHQHSGNTPWRIDVIALQLDHAGRIARLNHIPNAVEER
jgi:putative endonuclease